MKRLLPIVIVAVCAAVLAAGIIFGHVADVHSKAAHVCLECIGIG